MSESASHHVTYVGMGQHVAHRPARASTSDPTAALAPREIAGIEEQSSKLAGAGLASGVPVGGGALASIEALANALGVERGRLLALADAVPGLYSKRLVKKGGKVRVTFAPAPQLKAVQQALGALIRSITPPSPIARPDVIDAATLHCGAPWVLVGDAKGCHPSISSGEINTVLTGVDPEVVELIVRLSTRNGRLVQGAPVAPAIADCVLGEVDRELHAVTTALGVLASRFSDDYPMSAPDRESLSRAGAALAEAGKGHGLRMRLTKPIPRSRPQQALGLVLNGTRPSIPKAKRRAIRSRVRSILHEASAAGGLTSTDRRRVVGLINWVRRLHPTEASALDRMVAGLRMEEQK